MTYWYLYVFSRYVEFKTKAPSIWDSRRYVKVAPFYYTARRPYFEFK